MPTYEYHCPGCKTNYELRQGFDAETTQVCQECGKGTAKRILHAPKVVFKGSGFYATDSRNKSSSLKDSASESGDSKDSSGDGESKPEPKPDSKPETKSKPTPAAAASTAAS